MASSGKANYALPLLGTPIFVVVEWISFTSYFGTYDMIESMVIGRVGFW